MYQLLAYPALFKPGVWCEPMGESQLDNYTRDLGDLGETNLALLPVMALFSPTIRPPSSGGKKGFSNTVYKGSTSFP